MEKKRFSRRRKIDYRANSIDIPTLINNRMAGKLVKEIIFLCIGFSVLTKRKLFVLT
jgi:hypothetical protein